MFANLCFAFHSVAIWIVVARACLRFLQMKTMFTYKFIIKKYNSPATHQMWPHFHPFGANTKLYRFSQIFGVCPSR